MIVMNAMIEMFEMIETFERIDKSRRFDHHDRHDRLDLVGTINDKKFLQSCVRKVEKLVHRNIQYLLLNEEQEKPYLRDKRDVFLIWKNAE